MRKRIINPELKTTAIFKCIVTLKNGLHKTVRMTVEKVTTFFTALRMLKESPWLTSRYEEFFREIGIDFRDISHCKFINERTRDVLIEY